MSKKINHCTAVTMLPQKKTIEDLARELNLSKSTVSRALQDSYQIGEKTKQKVRSLAEKWGFQLNPHARGLKTHRSFTLGVLVPEIAHKYFSSAISGIQQVVLPAGYNVLIGQANESAEQEYKVVQQLVASRVDGLIMSLSGQTHHHEYLQALLRDDFPIIMFDRVSEDVNCSKVIIDHEDAAFKAIEHLICQGCKRIAHLSGPQVLSIAKNRIKGVRRALETHDLPFIPEFLIENGTNPEHTPNHIKWLMQQPDPPDGISCFNDDVAINALLTLKKDGIPVPGKVKIIGFNNEKECVVIEPNLSSIEHPVVEMGKEAARLFLKYIEKPNQNPQTIIFDTGLIVRQSTGG
ncbi:MAG: LacI family transcriptional regulator [Bacteroidales bacterium]|nr:LacI family transcriptional regulator [Bacteroidales bacterium]